MRTAKTSIRLWAVAILVLGALIGYFSFAPAQEEERFPLQLGLDLSGGVHLVYRADTSGIPQHEVADAMESLRDVIERRVNLFGVSEPLVQVESGSALAGSAGEERLIIELPGVVDTDQAIEMIGQTPLLEFMTERPQEDTEEILAQLEEYEQAREAGEDVELDPALENISPFYESTELTGRYLRRAQLQFHPVTSEAMVVLHFNREGAQMFAEMTEENVGRTIAIFLDRNLGNTEPISAPVVRGAITDGEAQISGGFTPEEARTLVGRLNSGALPVPIELLSTQTVGASLGAQAFNAGIYAGVIGLMAVAAFLLLWYRLPGLVAVVSLSIYVSLMIALFKLIPVTLTAAGIAGFVLSIGMAVDANILIFERMKEELRRQRALTPAIREGFSRAWLSIRDGNLSSVITAIILFWFGTSLVEGFALVFGLGVLVSMLSAITVTRTLLLAIIPEKENKVMQWLFGTGPAVSIIPDTKTN